MAFDTVIPIFDADSSFHLLIDPQFLFQFDSIHGAPEKLVYLQNSFVVVL